MFIHRATQVQKEVVVPFFTDRKLSIFFAGGNLYAYIFYSHVQKQLSLRIHT